MEYLWLAIVLVIIMAASFLIGCEVGVRYTKQRYRIGPMHEAVAKADRARSSVIASRETLEKFEGKMRLGGRGVEFGVDVKNDAPLVTDPNDR